MAHGHPDYGAYAPKATVYALQDFAELAARLGSPVTHDRRGDVIWFDDFESGVDTWTLSGGGTGNSQAWSSESARSGGFSVKHICGSNGTFHSQQLKKLAIATLSKLGCEFSIKNGTTVSTIKQYFYIFDGTSYQAYIIRYTHSTGTFAYFNSAAGYTDLSPTRSLYSQANLFHTIKVVVDASAKEYGRLIVNDHEYDLAGISPIEIPSALDPHIEIILELTGTSGENPESFIDDVIVTQNEP